MGTYVWVAISCSGSDVGFLYLLGAGAGTNVSGLDGDSSLGVGMGLDACSDVLD